MREEFVNALKKHQPDFGTDLSEDAVSRLADYYELVHQHNPLLHLVAPCSPGEFAVRHILESLTLLEHLPSGAKLADIGTGAGLPSIPCLLARDDLSALLIESKEKKAAFLRVATAGLGIADRAEIVCRQFAESDANHCQYVTCRALDRFSDHLPRLIKWADKRTLLLFGGRNLADGLQKNRMRFVQKLMPLSEQRFLFIVEK